MNLFNYKDLIDGNTMHIATTRPDNNPNLSIASDVRVVEENKIIISHNEMVNTPINVKKNREIVLTSFDKEFVGVRLFGVADYYTSGEYFDFCKKTFFGNGEVSPFGATEPKGAIAVTVIEVEDIK